MARYRRAAPWIIGVFGLMGAVVVLAVPLSTISAVEPTSRRTIVLASILAFAGVAVAIVASASALGPRSAFTEPVEVRRAPIGRFFSARRSVGDAFARQSDAEAVALVPVEMRQRLVRLEKDRLAVRFGFLGVVVGAIAVGAAMGIMLWEFENPETPFEIDRIAADTIRIEADADRLRAETRRIDAEIVALETGVARDEVELATLASRLEAELELLEADLANTLADTARIEADIEAGPLLATVVDQINDLEFAIETIRGQIDDLQDDIDTRRSIAG